MKVSLGYVRYKGMFWTVSDTKVCLCCVRYEGVFVLCEI